MNGSDPTQPVTDVAGNPRPADHASRAPCFVAAAVFLLSFACFAYTAAPTITFHDAGELVTGACTLGLSHSPGAPLWTLLGHAASKVPVGSPAYRLNLMSGFFGALTLSLVYLLTLRLIRPVAPSVPPWYRHAAAVFGALLLAQTPGFWGKCTQAELYTLNAAFAALLFWQFDRWCEREAAGDPHHGRLLVAMAAAFGLGAANYLGILYYVPILLLAITLRRPSAWKDLRTLLLAGTCFAAGCALYLYLPIRSLADPPLDWANPETPRAFLSAMKREWWGANGLSPHSRDFAIAYVKTFALIPALGLPGLGLVALGLVAAARRRALLTAVLVLSFVVYAAAMTWMMMSTPVLNRNLIFVQTYDLREIHIPMYLVLAVFAGVGAAALIEGLAVRRPGCPTDRLRGPAMAATGLLTVLVLCRVVTQWKEYDYHRFTRARDYGAELLRWTPPDSWVVCFPGSDNAPFILTYLTFCEGLRPDVALVPPSPAYIAGLSKIAEGPGAPLTAAAAAALLRSDPARFLLPMFNQPGLLPGTNAVPVVFANLPAVIALATQAVPRGMMFVLDGRAGYSRTEQERYWKDLLASPAFAFRDEDPPTYRENMMQVLGDHAWWHYMAGEFDLAAWLYGTAVECAPAPRADFMAYAADCLYELGRRKDAEKYARRALAVDPREKRALTILGLLAVRARDFGTAERCFQAILAIDPNDDAARINLDLSRRRQPAP